MTFRPGEMDQLIDIERETIAADGAGGGVSTWKKVQTGLWAHARPQTAREKQAHNTVEAHAMYLFVVRQEADVAENDRIVWDGDYYNVRGIKTRGGRNLYVQIEAERGVTQ